MVNQVWCGVVGWGGSRCMRGAVYCTRELVARWGWRGAVGRWCVVLQYGGGGVFDEGKSCTRGVAYLAGMWYSI